MNNPLMNALKGVQSVAITGHVRPDGDCIGSCLGLYNYLLKNHQDLAVDVYLEAVPDVYTILANADIVKTDYAADKTYDLMITLDSSDLERIGDASRIFKQAKKTLCIDHHISNKGYAGENVVNPQASSTCEMVYRLLDSSKVDQAVAEALYVGIICDTGCFKHSNTTRETMNVAGELIEKGVRTSKLTDEVFFQKTYMQNLLLGRCLLENILLMDGKCIVCAVSMRTLDFYGAKPHDLEGVIDQLRVTKGVEVAVLATEVDSYTYKISMRSNGKVNVNQVASYFGGGGHNMAAGCTMTGSRHDVINNLTAHIEEQLNQYD